MRPILETGGSGTTPETQAPSPSRRHGRASIPLRNQQTRASHAARAHRLPCAQWYSKPSSFPKVPFWKVGTQTIGGLCSYLVISFERPDQIKGRLFRRFRLVQSCYFRKTIILRPWSKLINRPTARCHPLNGRRVHPGQSVFCKCRNTFWDRHAVTSRTPHGPSSVEPSSHRYKLRLRRSYA